MRKKPPVSDAELEVLKVLWARSSATVREVEGDLRQQKRRLAYNTVLTLLTRLREKGYIEADRVCDGTASPLVHALVRGSRLSADDVAQLRKLLDELEREG